MRSMARLALAIGSREIRQDYIQKIALLHGGHKALHDYAGLWIELVAQRSQTLLTFNTILFGVTQLFPASVSAQKHDIAMLWALSNLPLLFNLHIFVGPVDRYGGVHEVDWLFRNAALRSLILDFCILASAILMLKACWVLRSAA